MSSPVRNSVKVLLLNDHLKLLLMRADDPQTTTTDGKYHGPYWFPIGGEIEPHESIQDAAIREIYEETGILEDRVELGSIVWFGEFDLCLNGVTTRLKQRFIVAKTKQKNVSLANLTCSEKKVIKNLQWFSLDEIQNSKEIIYPVVLSDYLPDILCENCPKMPIEIDLAKQPS